MKRIYLVLLALGLANYSIAQVNQDIQIQKMDKLGNWLTLKNVENMHPDRLAESVGAFLKLENSISFKLKKVQQDDLGFQHYRYEQFHNNVKVEGAFLYIHISETGAARANGRLVKGIELKSAQLGEDMALTKAKDFINAPQYYWEIPEMEAFIKKHKNDENATYFPEGELVYSESMYSQDGSKYTLNWKFEINAKGDKQRTFVFVNALTGEISHSLTGIHSDASEGTAVTRYHYTQTIIADSTGASDEDFILYDDTRGGGIRTWDMNESEDYFNAVNFTDEDNYWDNANADMDEVAGDTHWGMEMVYDYFLLSHNHNSYDDNGSTMESFIHYGTNYFNAFWNGLFMTFGDGASNPLTSIDVVAHEFAHGVTGYSAGLIYQYESGALNESFSDIFGTAVEFYALPDSADWLIGRENFTLRNMEDPNSYGDPDTYQGMHWITGDEDNGGVHTNSSVQNKWYFLLSEGGSGQTDNGEDYEVEGIGRIKAEAIAYRNLTQELGPSSQYMDARYGSVIAAVDLYGACSFEVEQTLKAWHAVGLGYPGFTKDMNVSQVEIPESSCYLSESETMEVSFIYNYLGCDVNLELGEVIEFGYIDENGESVAEELILSEDLQSGDEINYVFDQNLDLSADGKHEIKVWVTIANDLIPVNDTLLVSTTHQVELMEDDVVGFESYSITPDSLRVERGEYSEAKISSTADNSGSKGFKFSGYNVHIDEIEDVNWENYLDWPEDESDNFNTDPEYISKLCFCVDATEMDYTWLAFDMKQLHSAFWFEQFGEDRTEFVSSMRILVEGEQIGDQYHPDTYDDDPYLTRYVDLTAYSNSTFELCFQSKNFIRNIEDPVPGSTGDNTYLDNIRFIDSQALEVKEELRSELKVFPNPASGSIFIDMTGLAGVFQVEIHNSIGKVIHSQTTGENALLEVDLSNYERGMYLVRLIGADRTLIERIVLQ